MFMDEEMLLINHGKSHKYTRSFLKGFTSITPQYLQCFLEIVLQGMVSIRKRKLRRVLTFCLTVISNLLHLILTWVNFST